MFSEDARRALHQRFLQLVPYLHSESDPEMVRAGCNAIIESVEGGESAEGSGPVDHLIRPKWKDFWRQRGRVACGWFGRDDRLVAAFQEMVRIAVEGVPPHCPDEALQRLRKAIGDYLWSREIVVPPAEAPRNGRDTPALQDGGAACNHAAPEGRNDPQADFDRLPPSRRKAYGQYQDALRRGRELGPKSEYREVYDWLKKNSEDELPKLFETWAKYVRQARKALGQSKNSPRAGRETGKTVVRPSEI